MPALVCPQCATVAHLPDTWPYPGFTCGRCGIVVAISQPTVPPPTAASLDFPIDAPPRVVEYRNKTRARDAARTSFGEGFGQEMGRQFASCLIGLFVMLAAATAIAIWLLWRRGGLG